MPAVKGGNEEVKVANTTVYLRKIPLFAHLTQEELELIDRIVKVKKYSKDSLIFVEGEYGNELYFVKSGKVKVSKMLEDGSEKILHFLKEGDIFAEVLIFKGGEYPATAQVMEESEIGIIANEDLERLLKERGDITFKIMEVMAERLRNAQYHIRDLALRDVDGRLAISLLSLAEEHGTESERGKPVNISISQQQLANLVGASRETVARILSSWKKKGFVQVRKNVISIKDVEGLKSLF
jgi:CRP/FNR family cyclic AMP-dependent transcriptional regulator